MGSEPEVATSYHHIHLVDSDKQQFTSLHVQNSIHAVCFAICLVLFLLQANASEIHKPQTVIMCSRLSRWELLLSLPQTNNPLPEHLR